MATQAAPRVFSQPPEAPEKLIGTHDGHFHCDEVLACSMLALTAEFRGAPIVRSRNPEFLKQCNVVVDVGGEYLPDTLRFDHHQPGFTGTMTTTEKPYATKLSSAGLVYKHFGMEVLGVLLPDMSQTDLAIIHDRVYRNFIEHIDGIDNGIEEYALSEEDKAKGAALVRNYVSSSNLSARVGRCNPKWNEQSSTDVENERFVTAMALAGQEFSDVVRDCGKVWWPARSVVRQAVDTCMEVHPSGSIIRLETPCPWHDHLNEIEEACGIEGRTLYVLFGDTKGNWRVQAVGVKGTKFQNRRSLPTAWRGLRDAELSDKSGIPECVFVHMSGFIGGNRTYEGAYQMAEKSLTLP